MQTTSSAAPTQPTTTANPFARWFHLLPEDGILTFVLVVIVVFTTIASIQAVTPAWAPGLDILTPVTAVGLLMGYLSVQQRLLPGILVQLLATAAGVYFSFIQTANSQLAGDRIALWRHTQTWFHQAIILRQSSDDNIVFLLFLAILSFQLAYISVWLVVRTRRPWLAALANGVVLLINLNSTSIDKSVFFIVIYLLATLLLLVRFTLAENMRLWKSRGLRFSPDLGWDFMQAGAIFVVVVLVLAYLLPAGTGNSALADYWNSPTNPWQTLEARVAVIFNGAGGTGPGSINFFGSSLQLTSSVSLPDVPVLQYTVPGSADDPSQYLLTQTFDIYNGQNQWSSSPLASSTYSPNVQQPSTTAYAKLNAYTITVVRAMDGNHLFAPGDEAAQFSVPSVVSVNTAQVPAAWSSRSVVTPGQSYLAQGYVSNATADQLSTVPYPTAAPTGAYPQELLQQYLLSTNPDSIAPDVVATAQSVTQSAPNMYVAAVDLENYLRQFKYSLNNPTPPPGTDAVSFFLKTQQGFCTHFATAMAIMGRALGMPTRVALGFSSGHYDDKSHSYVVRGTEAHAWTQIYFAQYGWINFEPTSSFTKFTRAAAPGAGGATTAGSDTPGAVATPGRPRGTENQLTPGGSTSPAGSRAGTALVGVGLGLSLIIVLILAALVVITLWWRIIFRGLPPVSGAFARVAALGKWAGAPPKRSQTPIEYADTLAGVVPAQRTSLQQLSEIYSRERWGGGAPPEALEELPHLYDQVRLAISRVILRRLRSAPFSGLTRGRKVLRGHRRRG